MVVRDIFNRPNPFIGMEGSVIDITHIINEPIISVDLGTTVEEFWLEEVEAIDEY